MSYHVHSNSHIKNTLATLWYTIAVSSNDNPICGAALTTTYYYQKLKKTPNISKSEPFNDQCTKAGLTSYAKIAPQASGQTIDS